MRAPACSPAAVKAIWSALGLAAAVTVAQGNDGDWCKAIPWDIGQVPLDAESPWLQSLRFGAYIHLQAAGVDGRAANQDFHYDHLLDVRRTRLTMTAQAAKALTLSVHANMDEDEGGTGGGVEFDYISLFTAYAELDLVKWMPDTGLRKLAFGYGKRKLIELNEEDETSVNLILTPERSTLSNFVVPFRAGGGTTGAWTTVGWGDESITLGVFSSDTSQEFGTWDDGTLLVGAWRHDFAKTLGMDEAILSVGGAIQDVKRGDEAYSAWEWVVTPWLRMRKGPWELRVSGVYGELEGPDKTTGGPFGGVTVMPAYWMVKDKFQWVARYAVMSSDAARGLQLNGRYAREAGNPANEAIPSLAAGRGDFHQAVYGGFVWWPCPKHWSVLGGVEWEQLSSQSVNVYRGTTLWLATRVVF